MDDNFISACIALVGLKGTPADICVMYTRLENKLGNHVVDYEMRSRQYISELIDLIGDDGSLPFKFKKSNPKSVLYSATGLTLLNDTGVVDKKVLGRIIQFLIQTQDDKGWWKDSTDLLEVNNLPFYQDPMNASVRIFNTASVGSVLIKFTDNTDVQKALECGIIALKGVLSSNGSLIGFPQSTLFATPYFGKYFGLESIEFSKHLEVLETMINTSNSISDIITIGEQLVLSEVPHTHPIIGKCRELILNDYSEGTLEKQKIGGWKQYKQFDPSLTIRALLFLLDTD